MPTEPEPGLVGQPTYTYAPERVKRRRAWAKIVGYALATLVLLGLAGGAGFLQHQTQSALDATQARLDATEQDLADTHASLEEAETSLDDTESELSETRSQLDAAERRLTKKERQLTGVRGTLTNTRHQLDLQAGQIETLKTCLDGVTDAMTYAAYSDYTSAIAALDAVQISCNRAYELF